MLYQSRVSGKKMKDEKEKKQRLKGECNFVEIFAFTIFLMISNANNDDLNF